MSTKHRQYDATRWLLEEFLTAGSNMLHREESGFQKAAQLLKEVCRGSTLRPRLRLLDLKSIHVSRVEALSENSCRADRRSCFDQREEKARNRRMRNR
jgi:hypothetical protein